MSKQSRSRRYEIGEHFGYVDHNSGDSKTPLSYPHYDMIAGLQLFYKPLRGTTLRCWKTSCSTVGIGCVPTRSPGTRGGLAIDSPIARGCTVPPGLVCRCGTKRGARAHDDILTRQLFRS